MEERSFFYRYCIIIPDKYSKISDYFESILKENSFDIQTIVNKNNRYICLSQKDEKKMLKMAELLKIKKIYSNKNNLEENKIETEDMDVDLPKQIKEIEKEHSFIQKKKIFYLKKYITNYIRSI